MGQIVHDLAKDDPDVEIVTGVDLTSGGGGDLGWAMPEGMAGRTLFPPDQIRTALTISDVDVLMIFHDRPDAVVSQARTAADLGIPVVVLTTGLSQDDKDGLLELSEMVAVLLAPNCSTGVNLLFKLAVEVAEVLVFDAAVEITEIHHEQKVDSPSGTAAELGRRVAEALDIAYQDAVTHGREGRVGRRPSDQIGMHSLRGGDVAGEHTVSFLCLGERIELTHKAHSPVTFARGAIRAAKWMAGQPAGWYSMANVLGLTG